MFEKLGSLVGKKEQQEETSDAIAKYSRESLDRGRALAERLSGSPAPPRQSRLERLRQFLPLPRRRA